MDSLIFLVIFMGVLSVFVTFLSSRRKLKDISGKVVLVTGGANGLGREICIELSKLGCKLAIVDIDIVGAEKTLKMLSNPADAKAYRVDLTQRGEIAELKTQVQGDFGYVDILVNNAGLISYNTIFAESEEFIEKMTRVNLIATIWMTRLFLRDMIDRKTGHIVTISSLGGIYHYAFGISYVATKFGVTGFMMALKEFLRFRKLDKDIHTTLVMPDVIATREDVINAVSKSYNILSATSTAIAAVEGLRRNASEVAIPKYFNISIRLFQILPYFMQNFIRDHIRQDSKMFIIEDFEKM